MVHRVLFILVFTLVITGSLPELGFAGTKEIAVTGYGVAAAKPDYATIDIPISILRKKAEEATQAAAVRYDSLISVLERKGIEEDDYYTMRYTVTADWERDDRGHEKKFRGYVVRHVLRVRVSDLKMIGQIVDAAVGVGMIQINEIRFYSSKSDSLSNAALAHAVQDAHERAEIMANALGGDLGSLIELVTEDASRIRRRGVIEQERVQALAFKAGIVRVAPQEIITKIIVLGCWEFIETK